MQLIIPMSGEGSRFKAAGYSSLKPLIQVDGKPIIAHVLSAFLEATSVVFICNEEHLRDIPELKTTLASLVPEASIVPIAAHKKGPVHALQQASTYIKDDEPVMVSYCDYSQHWDSENFLKEVEKQDAAGAVPSYTDFHPHLWRNNVYAGVRVDESGRMLELQEKHCFTDDPQDCHHSSGAYFFCTGAILKTYINKLVDSDETINGEFYVSMLYPLMLKDGLNITVPKITHFMQWGTPEDLEEYEAWGRLIYQDRGHEKPLTEIPPGRESFVTIPHQEDSNLFKQTYRYWKASHKL